MLILGPLGGVTSAYMFFTLGFAVGGQVLAGILGSAVTFGYGPEGKHGGNYIQTLAASVASMAGMCVLIQAMVWLGMPMPATWKLMLYFGCIGMFGIGVGMLYTPILVDRLQLEYPSGHAVANILRALTDPKLLRRSIGRLGGGTGAGLLVAGIASRVKVVEDIGVSASTVGAGLIVGSRIGVPAAVMAGVGYLMTPYLRSIGVLRENDPFRKIGFLVGLAMIFSAGIVDLTFIAVEAVRRVRARSAQPAPAVQSGGLSTGRLVLWVAGWGLALVLVATLLLGQPVGYVLFALVLVFLFVFINGISQGISDWNPISSAFVVSVLLMSAIGPARSDRGDDGGQRAAGVDDRRLRHAAGPVDGLAPGIEARHPVPLPGGRDRDGRGAVRVARETLPERISRAGRRHVRAPRSEGRHLAVRDDLQAGGRHPRHRPPGRLSGEGAGDRPRHRHRGRRRAAPAGRVEGLPAVHRVGGVRFCDRLDHRRDLSVEPLRVVDGRLPGSDGQPVVRRRQRGQLVSRAQAGRGRREHVGDGGARRQPRGPHDAERRTNCPRT